MCSLAESLFKQGSRMTISGSGRGAAGKAERKRERRANLIREGLFSTLILST